MGKSLDQCPNASATPEREGTGERKEMDWQAHFADPETWEPYVRSYALHMRVLCVATSRIEGCWTAYCHDVPGINHRHEMEIPLNHGDKLSEPVARAMFPEFEGVPYDG